MKKKVSIIPSRAETKKKSLSKSGVKKPEREQEKAQKRLQPAPSLPPHSPPSGVAAAVVRLYVMIVYCPPSSLPITQPKKRINPRFLSGSTKPDAAVFFAPGLAWVCLSGPVCVVLVVRLKEKTYNCHLSFDTVG
jgi:hypothetical protein